MHTLLVPYGKEQRDEEHEANIKRLDAHLNLILRGKKKNASNIGKGTNKVTITYRPGRMDEA